MYGFFWISWLELVLLPVRLSSFCLRKHFHPVLFDYSIFRPKKCIKIPFPQNYTAQKENRFFVFVIGLCLNLLWFFRFYSFLSLIFQNQQKDRFLEILN